MDDPSSSAVANNIGYTILPRMPGGQHAANVGELVQGIPRNLPQARKEAALNFLRFVTSYEGQIQFGRAGGVPVRTDVYSAPELAGDPAFRYLQAMLDSEPYLISFPRIPEGLEYTDVLERRLNEAISRQLTAREALNLAAEEIYRILDLAGYATGFSANN
jgi:multiple sugar transport system substrate-binding protein